MSCFAVVVAPNFCLRSCRAPVATIFSGGLECLAARNQRWTCKVEVSNNVLGSATISGATATLGTSKNPAENVGLVTATVVDGRDVYVTVTPSEWPAVGTAAYVGVAVQLSDGRIEACRIDLRLQW